MTRTEVLEQALARIAEEHPDDAGNGPTLRRRAMAKNALKEADDAYDREEDMVMCMTELREWFGEHPQLAVKHNDHTCVLCSVSKAIRTALEPPPRREGERP